MKHKRKVHLRICLNTFVNFTPKFVKKGLIVRRKENLKRKSV